MLSPCLSARSLSTRIVHRVAATVLYCFVITTGFFQSANAASPTRKVAAAAAAADTTVPTLPTVLKYTIVQECAHDTALFTEGLFMHQGQLLESAGQYGKSQLLRYIPCSDAPAQHIAVSDKMFAEGITAIGNTLYQLTWESGVILRYQLDTLQKIDQTKYTGGMWGLTTNGASLIMSDGTDTLKFVDPKTFATQRTLHVTGFNRSWMNLNELEYVNGYILANVWYATYIVVIDASNGNVKGILDFEQSALKIPYRTTEAVLNGIAWDERDHTLWLTGKWWPVLLKVKPEGALAEWLTKPQ